MERWRERGCFPASGGRRRRVLSACLLLVGLLVAIPAPTVRAATVSVNVATDAYHASGCAATGTGQCTLRDAVGFGNDHPGTTVDIQVGSLTLTIPPDATNDIETGDLNVLARMTITSTRPGALLGSYPRINATGLGDRILTVTGGFALTLSRVNLFGGTARAAGAAGAIYVSTGATVNGATASSAAPSTPRPPLPAPGRKAGRSTMKGRSA